MSLIAMLILAYGPLDWSFPWWLWTAVVIGWLFKGYVFNDDNAWHRRVLAALERIAVQR